ncbi:NAD(P)/FAD-dependent oxidoreductase [Marinigracilibium pacificum]|uniref:NAD(P)/FAD-dependent oxidoreductase n=1 Tax=Marinigracilibium pacificum TaxID=2729599 RepID=A0A848J3D2_9BACT|nr:FAD/NAD(P)-binding oxidoreductase [Marinigracilibium pacificum]NMM49040.1 NAD(P)/FAD-dependent oxidoreductase [Marinigracilibium pacificum]
MKFDVLIIGGGTAGIMTAAQLVRKSDKKLNIGLIEPSEKHYYQPAWTLVGAGTFDMKATIRNEADYIPSGVKWIKSRAEDINPENNTVTLDNGNILEYNYLVVAPGIQINRDGIPGLAEALDKGVVCSNYTDPEHTWKVLKNFKGGNALFTQANTPIKCGGAPQKIMYLASDYFERNNISEKTNVIFATPGGVIFGVKDFADTLNKVIERYDINTKFKYVLTRIDAENNIAYFKVNEDSPVKPDGSIGEKLLDDNEVAIPFDMLHLAPPQSAPDFIRNSPISLKEGPNAGWVDVDIETLQHLRYPRIFALGDVAALPTAKTGAAVRKQAPVVVANILNLIKNNKLDDPKYHGYSSCPLVTGYGKMVLAEFNYNNVRASDPLLSKFMDTSKESWFLWILKKYGLPYLYWNKMLKGKM